MDCGEKRLLKERLGRDDHSRLDSISILYCIVFKHFVF